MTSEDVGDPASNGLLLAGRRARRERLAVVAVENIGPYAFLRLERGGLEPGSPGQFFMLEAPGRVLPRPMSLCRAPDGELAFLIDLHPVPFLLPGRHRIFNCVTYSQVSWAYPY